MTAFVRPYRPDDLGQVLHLWESGGDSWPGTDASMRLLLDSAAVGLVAEEDGRIVACGLGAVAGGVGWISRTDVTDGSGSEVENELLDALADALVATGARLIAVVSSDGEVLASRGFRPTGAGLFERRVVEQPTPLALSAVGGRVIPSGLWDDLRGMDEAKEIIERRVILPLAEPELAARHAVEQPKAIVLFGPPGTGKTTFAKGIASRLAWPFVEIQPSEIGAEGAERQAKLLAETFDRLLELPEAVVFVDEVEDIASIRHEMRRVSPNITNEFLKQIPRMREARRPSPRVRDELRRDARPRVPPTGAVRLRAAGRPAERRGSRVDLGPLRRRDHGRARRRRRARRRPVHCSRRRTSSGPPVRPRSARSSASISPGPARARRRTTSWPRSPRPGRR